jgi:hypothetical protein
MTSRFIAPFFILTLVLGLFAVPQPVQAADGFLQKWFPAIFPPEDTGPRPEDTLQSPFGDNTAAPAGAIEGLEWRGSEKPVDQIITELSVPHRAIREITEWGVTQVFDQAGYQQYLSFLTDNNITKVLDSGKFHMRSFVRQHPLLLNEGAVDGRYRWLYEIPMMISYMEPNMAGYEEAEPVSQSMLLRIQIGRVKNADGTDGMAIETWNGKLEKLEKE